MASLGHLGLPSPGCGEREFCRFAAYDLPRHRGSHRRTHHSSWKGTEDLRAWVFRIVVESMHRHQSGGQSLSGAVRGPVPSHCGPPQVFSRPQARHPTAHTLTAAKPISLNWSAAPKIFAPGERWSDLPGVPTQACGWSSSNIRTTLPQQETSVGVGWSSSLLSSMTRPCETQPRTKTNAPASTRDFACLAWRSETSRRCGFQRFLAHRSIPRPSGLRSNGGSRPTACAAVKRELTDGPKE